MKLVTPEGELGFNTLVTPKAYRDIGDPKYSAQIIFEGDVAVEFKKVLLQLDYVGKISEGKMKINAHRNAKIGTPKMINPDGTPFEFPEGREFLPRGTRVKLQLRVYEHLNATRLGLEGIMVISLGAYTGGGAKKFKLPAGVEIDKSFLDQFI